MASIPELHGRGAGSIGSLRIPSLRSVPLTSRVAEIIDHPAFQRLRSVRQLGPTHLVYPGAVHTRFEHSLGVYDMARRYLLALLRDPHVAESLTEADVLCCLLAALLHDIGHYPFAHSLEAIHLKGRDTPRHEDLMGQILRGDVRVPGDEGAPTIASMISSRFDLDPDEVISLVRNKPRTHARAERRLVGTIISSGVDADKADYLERDSNHMGVTYGRNYDHERFLESLCVSTSGDSIAITPKGKVPAEIFIFCRYTMFSEAYWHHTTRAASAMVERALGGYQDREEPALATLTDLLLSRSDDALLRWFVESSPKGSDTHELLASITDGRRVLHKRILTLSRVYEDKVTQTAYERIYHLGRADIARLEARLRGAIETLTGLTITDHELLIDTPPRDKDRIETVEVVYPNVAVRRGVALEEISKVVQGIANDFVKVVKKIRVFVHPRVRTALRERDAEERARDELLDVILSFAPEHDAQQALL